MSSFCSGLVRAKTRGTVRSAISPAAICGPVTTLLLAVGLLGRQHADSQRHRPGGGRVVTGDQDRHDARRTALLDGGSCRWFGRVVHRDQAQQTLFGRLPVGALGDLSGGQRQDPESLARELGGPEQRRAPRGGLPARCPCCGVEGLDRALGHDQDAPLARAG